MMLGDSVIAIINECMFKIYKCKTDVNVYLTEDIAEKLEKIENALREYRDQVKNGNLSDEQLRDYQKKFSELKVNIDNIYDAAKKRFDIEIENEVNEKRKVTKVIPVEEQSDELIEEEKNTNDTLLKIGITAGAIGIICIIGALYYNNHLKNNIDYLDSLDNEDQIERQIEDLDDVTMVPEDDKEPEEVKENTNTETNTISNTTTTSSTTTTTDTNNTVNNNNNNDVSLSVNSYEDIVSYANYIDDSLKEFDTDDIVNAIYLANFDYIENVDVFDSRSAVLETTLNVGKINTTYGSDSIMVKKADSDIYLSEDELKNVLQYTTNGKLTTTNFANAKVDNKYDLYKVCEVCSVGINQNTELDFEYAKVYNDLVARVTRNFSLVENAPLQTYYVILGMYNASMDRIKALTAGQRLGPIYGDGAMIDDTYGDICVEDLIYASKIVNENGTYTANGNDANFNTIFYNDFLNDVILGSSRNK